MSTYYKMLIIIILIMLLSKTKQFATMQKQLVFVIALILICVSGLRYKVGTDYGTYIYNYNNKYKESEISLFSQPGISIVAKISEAIRDDYATFFFLMALLTIGLIIFAIYKHSIDIYFSILLFILMGMWHTSFNAVKQCAAIAILFCGQEYLIEKNLKKWCVVCIIASLFHITAWLMIPIYFIVTRKIDRKQFFLYVGLGVVITFGYDILFDIVAMMKQGQSVISIDSAIATRTVNIFRVLVNCAPVVLYIFLRLVKSYRMDERNNIYANMSILNGVLYVSAMKSVYLTRFCLYTDIFGILFMPYLVNCFSKKSRWIIRMFILVLYFFFWRYDLMKSSATVNFQWIFNR